MSGANTVKLTVWTVVKEIFPTKPLGVDFDAELRLREDLDMSSLELVSTAMEVCDRLRLDPNDLSIGSLIDEVSTVGDLARIFGELSSGQAEGS